MSKYDLNAKVEMILNRIGRYFRHRLSEVLKILSDEE